jgi:glycosyltransferase involved in cell wall biosynthesis
MPSDGEGFGLVYLEAMRASKPCIALRESAAAEIVVDGETGLLVGDSVDELTGALARLLADPAMATALGEAGRRRWQDRYHPARYARDLAPQLDRLLATERTTREHPPLAAAARE